MAVLETFNGHKLLIVFLLVVRSPMELTGLIFDENMGIEFV